MDWTDFLTFDPMTQGPPYLPGRPTPKVASAPERRAAIRAFVVKKAAMPDTEMQVMLDHLVAEFGGDSPAPLAVLLAALRAEAHLHLTHHWATKGNYADHLLFERLYEGANELVDPVAERAVGLGPSSLVHPVKQHEAMGLFLTSFLGAGSSEGPVEYTVVSLRTVLRVLVLTELVYKALDQKGALTLGVDNLVQSVADKHEEFAYLLQQRVTTGG